MYFPQTAHVEWDTFPWPRYNSFAFMRYVGLLAKGVYIIWYTDYFGNIYVVRVGQGYVRNRLVDHHNNPDMQPYAFKNLYVSWTPIAWDIYRRRVESYLGRTLKPKLGERFPASLPLAVNLPWDNY